MNGSRSSAMPSVVTEIVPGRLFAIGGSIPGSPHPCWMPADSDDWIPMQCYVIRSGATAVIMDTGTAVHRTEIRAGLTALLEDTSERVMLMTRREPDCSMNLPWIARDFALESVRCGGELNPLDFFDSFDDANIAAVVRAATPVEFHFVKMGETIELGDLHFQMLRPPVRVLSTSWFYERTTRTLFTSDFWGFRTCRGPSAPTVVALDGEPDVAGLTAFIGAKFDFLRAIDTRPMIDDLEALLARYPADRICPTYGCIIEGRGSVERLLAATTKAMRFLSTLEPRSVLEDFEIAVP